MKNLTNKNIMNIKNKIKIKHLIILIFSLLLVISMFGVSHANVIISEVLYDSLNSETSAEALELYNPTDIDVDISGYIIKTSSSATDATLPENSIIPAKSSFLIADSGFSEGKDSPLMPDADHEEAITLKNSDAGVALLSPQLNILDAVGWGSVENIDSSLYEVAPSSFCSPGDSLQRDLSSINLDTDNNAADFFCSQPTLNNSLGMLFIPDGDILFHVSVDISEIASFSIDNISIFDENPTTSTIDLYPIPKQKRYFNISVIIDDKDDIVTSAEIFLDSKTFYLEKSLQINSSHSLYTSILELDFFSQPKLYDINISLSDDNHHHVSFIYKVNYIELVALELDTSELSCSFIDSKSCIILGDDDISTTNSPTLRNIGNTGINTEISGLNFTSSDSSFNIENLEFIFDSSFPKDGFLITNEPLLYYLALAPSQDSSQEISFKLSLPDSVDNGEYLGKVSIIGLKD